MWLALPACARDVDAALPTDYRSVDVPTTLLSSSATRERGAATFQQYCAVCHGERGNGQGVRKEGLSRALPDFTDPRWRKSATPRRVFFSIREGRAPSAMPSWKALSEEDAWDLTAFVLTIGGER